MMNRELTSKELEVIGLLAKGLSNKEIGAGLSISEQTVKNHLYQIYLKLGVQSRIQAVLKVLDEAKVRNRA